MERCEGVVGVVQNVNPEPGNVIFGPASRLLSGRHYVEEVVCGVRIRLGITSFFQVNTPVAEKAYEAILARLDLKAGDTLLDLYSGVGAIGLIAARHVNQVFGLEEVPEAIEFAVAASGLNDIDNVSFHQGLAEHDLPMLMSELRGPGLRGDRLAVVLNPPRGGVHSRVVETLVGAMPARIAYLSCSPATLIRDLARFADGGYGLAHVELFDMFPQTEQIETLAILIPRVDAPDRPLRRARAGRR